MKAVKRAVWGKDLRLIEMLQLNLKSQKTSTERRESTGRDANKFVKKLINF